MSDFDKLPWERCGAISLFCCMVNQMVTKNKESCRNLDQWLQDFSLTNFPGKNITKASLCIKAIINAIGHDKLPSDVVTRVLNRMSTASTDKFCQICQTLIAMMHKSYLKQIMKVPSHHKQLVSILSDLEIKYLKLPRVKKWMGVGVNSKHENSAYSLQELPSCVKYRAYVVNASKSTLPFLKWVKTAKCHHCGKSGHICPMCHQHLDNIKTGKVVLKPFQHCPCYPCRPGNAPQDQVPGLKQHATKNPKFKALLSAMHDLIKSSNNKMEDDGVDGTQDAQNKESDTNTNAASSFIPWTIKRIGGVSP
jgi:hypothetical protein